MLIAAFAGKKKKIRRKENTAVSVSHRANVARHTEAGKLNEEHRQDGEGDTLMIAPLIV